MAELFGIDVAKYQHTIDWSKVNKDFVILKATEKNNAVEPSFERNYTGATSRNIPVGVYKYVYAKNVTEAKAEANALLNCSRQQTIGADLYLVGVNPSDNSIHRAKPCPLCARSIIQAGINNVYLRVGEGADEYVAVPAVELEWVQEI